MDPYIDPRVNELAETIINIIDDFRIESVMSERVLFDRGLVQFRMPSEFSLRSIRESLTKYPLAAYSYDDLITVADFLRQVSPMDDPEQAENFKHSLAQFSQNIDSIGRNYQTNAASELQREVDYLSRRVQEIKDQLSSLEQLGMRGRTIVDELEVLSQSVGPRTEALDSEIQRATNANKQFGNFLKEIESSVVAQKVREDQVKIYEQRFLEVSNKFLEYEKQITAAISTVEEVTGKADQINALLKAAEDAIGLKATEGISAAFIKERNESKKELPTWLWGTYIFLGLASVGTLWILTGYGLQDPQGWPSIIGRIAVVTIMVAGASFCSKQYVRQKSITDDYSYKAVLSQSIIAFTDQIKDRSDAQVVEYLKQVLAEIHKDPQRPRKANNSAEMKIEIMEMMNKVVEKVTASK